MDAAALIADITAAFPLDPVPKIGLYQTHMGDLLYFGKITVAESETALAKDGARTWKEYRDEELRELDAAMSHQMPEGFLYFLPAYLCAAVRHVLDDESWFQFVGDVIFKLRQPDEYLLARYFLFTPAQRAAVVRFLEFMAAHADEILAADARKRLERYWRKP